MARPAETYRGARRNAEFGRKPKGNTWPRLARTRKQRYRPKPKVKRAVNLTTNQYEAI